MLLNFYTTRFSSMASEPAVRPTNTRMGPVFPHNKGDYSVNMVIELICAQANEGQFVYMPSFSDMFSRENCIQSAAWQ